MRGGFVKDALNKAVRVCIKTYGVPGPFLSLYLLSLVKRTPPFDDGGSSGSVAPTSGVYRFCV